MNPSLGWSRRLRARFLEAVKALLFVSLALVGVGAVVAFAAGGSTRADDCSLARFDSRAWADKDSAREQPGRGPSTRQRLADQLIECETLLGARRTQVWGSLGRPDNYAAQDTRFYEEGTWSYTLGVERGFFGIDDEHLLVRFDPSRRVRSLELVTD